MVISDFQVSIWISLLIVRICKSNGDLVNDNCDLFGSMYGGKISAIFCTWRKASCLRPVWRRLRSSAPVAPACYWLLLLCGDVEINPGPVKFPCTICQRPVKRNQRGICCDACDRWTHAICASVGNQEYTRLSSSRESEWWCPTCIWASLPFLDSDQYSIEEQPTGITELDGINY